MLVFRKLQPGWRSSSIFTLWPLVVLLVGVFATDRVCAETCAGSWFKGDLHAHSTYSDGDSSVADVVAAAESLGFDFFVITDHDVSMNGDPVHWLDPGYHSENLILLYGVEWTTDPGHANVWAAAPFSYGQLWEANLSQGPELAIRAAHNEGALFSINHPAAPVCCRWQYGSVPENLDSIEVWNSMYRVPSLNGWSVHRFWDDLLQNGRRIAGVGGSDTHQLEGYQARLFGLGNPTTWVCAKVLDADQILGAIKAGHVSMSYAPDAVRVDFEADADGDGIYETMMGDNIPARGQTIKFRAEIIDPKQIADARVGKVVELPGRVVESLEKGTADFREVLALFGGEPHGKVRPVYAVGVSKNGRLSRVWIVGGGVGVIRFEDTPENRAYYRIELAGDPDVFGIEQLLYGKIIALTNPIYVGFPQE
jgi:hypothetical protein